MERHIASERRQAFYGHVRAVDVLPAYHLKRIINDKSYPLRVRAAALRVLVARAPIEVTHGRPYPERRLLVRKHYQV